MASQAATSLPRPVFNRKLFDSILDLWFSPLQNTDTAPKKENVAKWLSAGAEATKEQTKKFDQECRDLCAHALECIGPEQLPLPRASTREEELGNAANLAAGFCQVIADQPSEDARVDAALSLILLLDQVPRNIYRDNQGLIYDHFDRLARALMYCLTGQSLAAKIESSVSAAVKGLDAATHYNTNPAHRVWFYLPFQHSEYNEDHEEFRKQLSDMQKVAVARRDEKSAEFLQNGLVAEKQHLEILEDFGRYPYRNKWLDRTTTAEEQTWLDGDPMTFGA